MGKIMEAVFCVFYLVFTLFLGIRIVRRGHGEREFVLFGAMVLVLVGGDSFHLVPRILSAVRIALCLMPQNDWTGDSPVAWGIYRNIPFTVMGVVMVVLYFIQRRDRVFRWMSLAIALSFGFYLPVVLWSDVSPMVGMLMLPKTCMYIWMVAMGFNAVRAAGGNQDDRQG